MKGARQIVVEALIQMERHEAWSGPVLSAVLNKAKLSVLDRSFATALFYGTLTYEYTLDACIKEHSKMPFRKIDPTIKNILRTALYQLLHMDQVPDHSAVDEAVSLTRIFRKASASGFVNGVLRGFLRQDKKLPATKDPLLQLALTYACPPELVAHLQKNYDQQTMLNFLKASLETPPTFIRINTERGDWGERVLALQQAGLSFEGYPEVPNAYKILSGGPVQNLPSFQDGLFHVQDISSQRVALGVGAQEGERVLDCCAAPGGKSFILAQEVGEAGTVVACDLYPQRIKELDSRNQALGLKNIETHVLDMTQDQDQLGEFDRVLCDVPCSGYGTIRRQPEIKKKPLDSLSSLPALQYALLDKGGKYCKLGGILVYSTCTLNPLENEQVVEKFLENNPHYQLADPPEASFSQAVTTIQLGELEGDGFFVAVLKRTQ